MFAGECSVGMSKLLVVPSTWRYFPSRTAARLGLHSSWPSYTWSLFLTFVRRYHQRLKFLSCKHIDPSSATTDARIFLEINPQSAILSWSLLLTVSCKVMNFSEINDSSHNCKLICHLLMSVTWLLLLLSAVNRLLNTELPELTSSAYQSKS